MGHLPWAGDTPASASGCYFSPICFRPEWQGTIFLSGTTATSISLPCGQWNGSDWIQFISAEKFRFARSRAAFATTTVTGHFVMFGGLADVTRNNHLDYDWQQLDSGILRRATSRSVSALPLSIAACNEWFLFGGEARRRPEHDWFYGIRFAATWGIHRVYQQSPTAREGAGMT